MRSLIERHFLFVTSWQRFDFVAIRKSRKNFRKLLKCITFHSKVSTISERDISREKRNYTTGKGFRAVIRVGSCFPSFDWERELGSICRWCLGSRMGVEYRGHPVRISAINNEIERTACHPSLDHSRGRSSQWSIHIAMRSPNPKSCGRPSRWSQPALKTSDV